MNRKSFGHVQLKDMKVYKTDVIRYIWAICAYIFDIGSDVNVAITHYNAGNSNYCILTVIFIALPAVVMAIFSFMWYCLDEKEEKTKRASATQWIIRVLFSLLCMAPVLRYFESLYFAWMSWRSKAQNLKHFYARKSIYQKTDAALLRLFEAFLECGPQLVLQIYIFVRRHLLQSNSFTEIEVAQLYSVLSSLASISISMSTYVSALRNSLDEKRDLKCPVTLVVIAWRLFDITSRVIPLGLLASVSINVFWVSCSVHFIVMYLWILSMHTDFCDYKWGEYFYDGILGLILTFCFFNPKDEPSKWKCACFYSLMFVENALAMFFWYIETPDMDFKDAILIAECVIFFLSIALMVLYYKYLHPTIGTAAECLDDKMSMILKEGQKLAKCPTQIIKNLATKTCTPKNAVASDDSSVILMKFAKIPETPVQSRESNMSETQFQNSRIGTNSKEIQTITDPISEKEKSISEFPAQNGKMSVILGKITDIFVQVHRKVSKTEPAVSENSNPLIKNPPRK